ncbi:MAG TPA: cupin domain-containing protein [Bacteroidales bacterium]|nr:cupin domain-containing protein [Bacteroidales bacterium]
MKRRLFLQFPVLATVLISTNQIYAKDKPNKTYSKERPKKGFKVSSGKDRFQKELNIMGGQFNRIVSSQDTDGDLLIYNTFRQEKGGPAFHLHHEQDEWFYVIKGEFTVKVGEDTFTIKPGDSAFAPRTIPHAFAKINEGEGQLLVLFQPAGSMEDFFEQISKLGSNIPKDQEQVLKNLYETHGMQVVGPPLKF